MLSISIMACKERENRIPYLKSILGDVPVSMDSGQYKNIWENCKNAWSLYDKNAKWHLVIQDDSIIPKDFLQRLENILTDIGDKEYTLALYAGGVLEKEINNAKENKEPYFINEKITNENALVIKTDKIDEMIKFCDRRNADTDRYISQFCNYKFISICYPVPSIVQHSDDNVSFYRLNYNQPDPHLERRAVWYCED